MNRYTPLLMLLAACCSTVVAQVPVPTNSLPYHSRPTNPNAPTKEMRRQAEQGDVTAQLRLGICYDNGLGVAENNAEAVKWFRRAAEQGDKRGQYFLGVKYAKGEGVAESIAEAVKWYRLAAEQGQTSAQTDLGEAYFKGDGVPKSKVDAYFWWNLAAADDNAIDAQRNKAMIAKEMTREQIAEAQRRSAAWKPKTAAP